MKHQGRGVIRIGDKTDHGGEVISASSGTVVMGKFAALQDDMTICPRCKGEFAIKPDGSGAKHMGRFYAYHNDITACGARLITSLDSSSAPSGSSQTSSAGPNPVSGLASDVEFNDYFQLLDANTGQPLRIHDYALVRANGNIEYGTTGINGNTHMLSSTATSESVDVFV